MIWAQVAYAINLYYLPKPLSPATRVTTHWLKQPNIFCSVDFQYVRKNNGKHNVLFVCLYNHPDKFWWLLLAHISDTTELQTHSKLRLSEHNQRRAWEQSCFRAWFPGLCCLQYLDDYSMQI